ncbi:hypothetical protein CO180_03260 [candidate division WWE3 bacterium CG_4_9_14_3_um_filter_41_6]|uniref:Uncharacterized protein n=1 Tax=candidate division WWE3 bacterium CG_4_10_14_0_2_um_filter_41_14 TaxID=1975072 RepID=A0A2M7TM10_UNCKA|nr:MAG: hypothetical protein COY32_00295 [candidate division WWE3 bacterium CG_4_10_14_0_2_um_filter_41_14]PJA38549.1 MAG: hypothetical protein CO180_03260 [candidate division WWE3 bacterium CG_4_9_14_3_um_filter_41_6]
MDAIIRDFLTAFVVVELLFAYLEYRYQPDLFYILGRLVAPKYLVPSIILPTLFVLLKLLINFLF